MTKRKSVPSFWPDAIPDATRAKLLRRAEMIASGARSGLTGEDMRKDAKRIAKKASGLLKLLRRFESDYPSRAADEAAKDIAREGLRAALAFDADETELALFEAGLSAQGAQWPLIAIEAHANAIGKCRGTDGRRKNYWERWLIEQAAEAFKKHGLEPSRTGAFAAAAKVLFEKARIDADPDAYIREFVSKAKTPKN